jgi:NADH-quinone oxidoreductase subunit J
VIETIRDRGSELMEVTLNSALFYALAAITGVSAIAVVVTQNIVRAATWLLFALAGTAGIFFLLGAPFLGATQLLVYVGGTLVLVVFGVMLTAQGPFINMRISAAEWFIAMTVGLVLYGVLALSLVADVTRSASQVPVNKELIGSKYLGAALLGDKSATPEANVTGLPPDKPARKRDKITYLLPFEIVSVHLLVVLIGAAYLARTKRRRGANA